MNTEGYTKLSATILTSTIWMESDQTLRVWVTLLALCDRHGFVSGTVPGLSNVARVSIEDCRSAIGKFLAPDPDSRTKDNDGRRLQEVDGGWMLLNFLKYREERDAEERREYMRNYVAGYRKSGKDKARPVNNPVNNGKLGKLGLAQAEAEAEAEAEAKAEADPTKKTNPPLKKAATAATKNLADADWIVEISKSEACRGIDVPRELARAQLWCSTNNRACSRKFFTNWLNRTRVDQQTISTPGQSLHTQKSKYGF